LHAIKTGFQTLWTLFKPISLMRSQQEQSTNIQSVHNGHKIKSLFLVREAVSLIHNNREEKTIENSVSCWPKSHYLPFHSGRICNACLNMRGGKLTVRKCPVWPEVRMKHEMAAKNGTIFQHWTSPGFTLHPLFLFLNENSRTTSCLTSLYHPCWLVQEWRGTGPMPEAFGTVHEICITRGCREHVPVCVT